MYILYTV